MAQKIEVEITSEGRLKMEFTGFAGDECYDEAERIEGMLAELGIRAKVLQTERKPGGQIEAELGIDDKDQASKIPTEE